jgi:uncharacterized membrane protein YjjB (DUF3815 family)
MTFGVALSMWYKKPAIAASALALMVPGSAAEPA